MTVIDALGWPERPGAATIAAMKQARQAIGFVISAAGLAVLAAGLI